MNRNLEDIKHLITQTEALDMQDNPPTLLPSSSESEDQPS